MTFLNYNTDPDEAYDMMRDDEMFEKEHQQAKILELEKENQEWKQKYHTQQKAFCEHDDRRKAHIEELKKEIKFKNQQLQLKHNELEQSKFSNQQSQANFNQFVEELEDFIKQRAKTLELNKNNPRMNWKTAGTTELSNCLYQIQTLADKYSGANSK